MEEEGDEKSKSWELRAITVTVWATEGGEKYARVEQPAFPPTIAIRNLHF